MPINMKQFHQTFFDESFEGLQIMESGLLRLSEAKDDLEQVNTVFRAAHSIKGGSGTFGFSDISSFTHHMETLLDQLRSGQLPATDEMIDLLLRSTDCLREMLKAAQEEIKIDTERSGLLSGEFERFLRINSAPCNDPEPALTKDSSQAGWRIHLRPLPHLFKTGNDPVRLFRALQELGDLTVETDMSQLPPFAEMDPECCYLNWALTLHGDIPESSVREIFEWIEGDCELAIESLTDTAHTAPAIPAVEEKSASALPAPSIHPPQQERRSGTDRRTGADRRNESTSIRVSIEKIDSLLNTVGELVITQAMLSQLGENFDIKKLDRLRDGLDQLERNTHELQESVMSIRMLPMSFAFNRFPRLVHDLSQKLGKKVDLQIAGEQTELDKTVLEKIGDPLIHLIRNSLDHGIETPAVRMAAGKPETGIVRLSACHKGGNIIIEVSDDGAGINKERLREKARERGLAGSEGELSEEKLFELIFLPGMSTAETVSDISGRGVGMDVVRRNIRELQGHIEVQSHQGQGTTFIIRLPLTLAILDGQLVRVGKENCIIPLVSICESLQMEPERVSAIAGRAEIYSLRGNHIPIVQLANIFGFEGVNGNGSGSLLVVVEGDGQRIGLVVNELFGQQQVVIKSLETNFKRVEGISGATILGDGTVALIIDIAGLIALARRGVSMPADMLSTGGIV